MKKFAVVLLFGLVNQAHASMCQLLRITVKNDTPSACYLIQKSVQSGNIYKKQPYKIRPGATVTQFEVFEGNRRPASILMTYECSENHSITFLSSKSECFYRGGRIEGMIVKANNLTAVYTANEGSYFSEKAGSIHWTIS
jgi:hypothetical protein